MAADLQFKYLSDSVYGFSDLPIRALTLAGFAAMVLALLAGTVVLLGRLTGHIRVEGYTPVILSVVFFGGLNAFASSMCCTAKGRRSNSKRDPASTLPALAPSRGQSLLSEARRT